MATRIEMDEITQSPDPKWLDRRIRAWESEAIISHEQGDAIRDLEGRLSAPESRAGRYQRLTAIVSTFGAILIGIGIILFVGSNWADLPNLAKLLLAASTVVAFEVSGYWLRYHSDYPRTGGALLFIGAAAYGAGIFLVAQTYNYPVDDPNLLLLWFLPVLPLAYLVAAPSIAALGIVVGYSALGYRGADWLEGTAEGIEAFGFQTLGLAVATATAAVGFLHQRDERFRRMGAPFQWIGSMTVVGIVFLMSFKFWYSEFSAATLAEMPAWMVGFLVAAASVCAAAFFLLNEAVPSERTRQAKAAIGITGAVTLAAILVMFIRPFASELVPFALMNTVLLAAVVGFVFVGIGLRQEALVNLSLAVFVLAVMSRYIEIGGGMFGTAISMIVGGLLLLGLGFGIERVRKQLIVRYELRGES